jgi:DHA1 family multidrug resistance protein-like MFS transporter
MSYPQYAASLFAGNDFCRSLFAFGTILFSRPMYLNLGIGRGVSLLGGLSVMGIVSLFLDELTNEGLFNADLHHQFGIWALYFYGAKLRARSKFAMS